MKETHPAIRKKMGMNRSWEYLHEDASLLALIKECCNHKDLSKGSRIHAHILQKGSSFLTNNVFIATALVTMYAKCGELLKARDLFDEHLSTFTRDLVSWTSLISGYSQHGFSEDALKCFDRMRNEGLHPDAFTFSCVLKVCGSIGASHKGKEIHVEIVNEESNLFLQDPILGSALVDMYAKCGYLTSAQRVFDEIHVRNVISWTALITGFCKYGQGEEALSCFRRMLCEGISPNPVTFCCVLKACGNVGIPEKGKEVHAEIVREGMLANDSILGNALVDMYAKCGILERAQKVFDKLLIRNVVSWTSLLAGYAQLGKHDIVFYLFCKMRGEGIEPNFITFLVVLNACSFSGLVTEGETYFEVMRTSYGIIPTLEHHTCMVDLFSRSGHFDKAMEMIEKMPSSEYLPLWVALLGACYQWGNVKLGRLAFEHVVKLESNNEAAFICMSNIYMAAGMVDEAANIEAMRENYYDKHP